MENQVTSDIERFIALYKSFGLDCKTRKDANEILVWACGYDSEFGAYILTFELDGRFKQHEVECYAGG